MTRPGITLFPVRSTTVAPSGVLILAASPISAMLPSRRMRVWFAFAGPPVPSITLTFVSATTGASTVTKPRTVSLN